METAKSVAMDNGGPKEDIGVVGLAEKGNGAIKAAKGGVGALKLEIQNGVEFMAVADKSCVELENVVYGL